MVYSASLDGISLSMFSRACATILSSAFSMPPPASFSASRYFCSLSYPQISSADAMSVPSASNCSQTKHGISCSSSRADVLTSSSRLSRSLRFCCSYCFISSRSIFSLARSLTSSCHRSRSAWASSDRISGSTFCSRAILLAAAMASISSSLATIRAMMASTSGVARTPAPSTSL